MNKLIIIGASGHGRVVSDIAKRSGYSDIAFFDDDPSVKTCGNYPVLGCSKDALLYKDCDFVVAIGNAEVRRKIQTELTEQGLNVVSLSHPNAVIADDVTIGAGTVVMAGAVLNPCVTIGQGCIINTCSSVDHDCLVGDFVHISVGAHIAGTVTIGDDSFIGSGATVINDIDIAHKCIVGAGAVVVTDLSDQGVYVGLPARKR